MNKPAEHTVAKAVDPIQQRLTDYACGLHYDDLPPESVHAAKIRIIDTLGALLAGFSGEPCRLARDLAARMPNADGATVIGTRIKTTPDMAAFVNATTARCVNFTDTYHWPGSAGGHPSDVITPVLAVAEHARAGGREFIAAVVLAYEVFIRTSDVFHSEGFDYTNFSCLGTAVAAGKLLGLSPGQLSHCIAMAVVPNIALKQTRIGHLSTWKMAASGQAGRAGVFAAMLAQAGMEGAYLPFVGKAGWCDQVAKKQFSLDVMGGKGTPFKIADSTIKTRPAVGLTIASVLAAEKAAPLKNINAVRQITVEVYKKAKAASASGEHDWNPDSAETADHSIPYLVAAALMDGTLTPRSYDDAHLWNPELRALMQKVEVIENPEFTLAYERLPAQQCARVTVVTGTGERSVGEARFGKGDKTAQELETQITDKFRSLSVDMLDAGRVDAVLDRLLHLENSKDVSEILPLFERKF